MLLSDNSMKRFLYLYLVGCIAFCSVLSISAQDDWMGWNFQYQGICYTIVSDSISQEVEVSPQTDGSLGREQVNYPFLDTVVIPSIVYDGYGNAYTVIGIGSCAFIECHSLKKIILPQSVKYLSGWAFMGCVNLEYIEIPDHLEWIGPYVFADCSSLVKPQIPTATLLDEHALIWASFNSK